MKEIKLQSMTDFVLNVVQTPNINEAICWEQTQNRLDRIYQYSLFLKQPLKLEMFVACDGNCNVLSKVPCEVKNSLCADCDCEYNYEKAKEKVLFLNFLSEDFDKSLAKVYIDEYFNIEQLSNEIREIHLTQSAIKQIGL